MSTKKYARRWYSKRASASVKSLADRKYKYQFARAMPRIRARSRKLYG